MDEKKNVTMPDELRNMEYEPLDATELKLIHWSWGLGVALLVILFVVSKYLMPVIDG